MPIVRRAVAARPTPFLLIHAILIPAVLALAAVIVHGMGIDEWVSALFFDARANTFPARASVALEWIGHRLARSVVAALWLVLLAAAIAASVTPNPRRLRAVLWTTVVAMALGPSIVVLLKNLNSIHCPWDLKRFGGYADFSNAWFVSSTQAGKCFPSGHASGGFSLIALMFAGIAERSRRLRALGLTAALAVGGVFSVVCIVQGAHFLSHNLWSAAIDWCVAALAFAPLLVCQRDQGPSAPASD